MADLPTRQIVRHGDKTTAGGTVIAPDSNYMVMGKQIANVGCMIECPACNGVGSIQSVPPMPTTFDYGGLRAAFGGDLCICGCNPPPRLIASIPASQYRASSYEAPIASTPAAAEWLSYMGYDEFPDDDLPKIVEQYFELVDGNGNPVEGYKYDLFQDGKLLTKAQHLSYGKTIAITGSKLIHMVAWNKQDGVSKS